MFRTGRYIVCTEKASECSLSSGNVAACDLLVYRVDTIAPLRTSGICEEIHLGLILGGTK